MSRVTNKTIPFSVQITPYNFTEIGFHQACENVANKIAALGKQIFIGFSGGADSEYVVRTFNKLNIPFTTLTVVSESNNIEMRYARRLYRKLPNVNKTYLQLTTKEYAQIYVNLVKTFNFPAINIVYGYKASQFAKANNGIFVTGDTLISNQYKINNDNAFSVGFCEWDYYYDLIDSSLTVPFFQYDTTVAYAAVKRFNKMKEAEFKEFLYGDSVIYRPKLKQNYGLKLTEFQNTINKTITTIPMSEQNFTKTEFMQFLEPFKQV